MKDKEIEKNLRQFLQQGTQPERLEETIMLCTEIVREYNVLAEEPRTGFFKYLSEVFRFTVCLYSDCRQLHCLLWV